MAPDDRTYLLFAGAALAVALLAGFVLAVLLPLAMALDWGWGARWPALAQAHGHAQVMGWAGLFILGMGYRLVPRFTGVPLRGRALVVPSGVLLAAGVGLRVVLQPLADHAAAGALLPLSALLELAGAAIFAGLTLPALLRATRARAGFAPYLVAVDIWLVTQAALAVPWLWDAGRSGVPYLPWDQNRVLLAIQFYGVLLPAIFGVSLRTVPVFFGRPLPGARAAWPGCALLQAGLLAYTAAALWRNYHPEASGLRAGETAALLLVAAGLVAPLLLTGAWRRPSRLRPGARPAARFVQVAYAWTALAGLLLAYAAATALAAGRDVLPNQTDAVRHLLAVGTVTTMIVGMARLITPAFAVPRQYGAPRFWEVQGILLGLSAATFLRFLGAWPRDPDFFALQQWMLAAAGLLALVAVALFAASLVRSARRRPLPGPAGGTDQGSPLPTRAAPGHPERGEEDMDG
ncbi:MAG TPA: NnrS family protein [Dehalococcoidia bacterium]